MADELIRNYLERKGRGLIEALLGICFEGLRKTTRILSGQPVSRPSVTPGYGKKSVGMI
jgi:hypothetical protein